MQRLLNSLFSRKFDKMDEFSDYCIAVTMRSIINVNPIEKEKLDQAIEAAMLELSNQRISDRLASQIKANYQSYGHFVYKMVLRGVEKLISSLS